MARVEATIGNWSTSTLVRFVRDVLDGQKSQRLQTLKVEELEVVSKLILRDILAYDRDASTRLIGATSEPAFENSWVNYSAGSASAGYWRDPLGIVHLQGLIKSGTVGSAAFTLPPGYRPDSQHVFGSVSNGAAGRVDVFADGEVVPATPSSNTWVTLDGITFRAQ